MKLLRLASMLLVLTTIAVAQQVKLGSIDVSTTVTDGTNPPVTWIFVHLDSPEIQPTPVDGVFFQVNGKRIKLTQKDGPINLPSEFALLGSAQPGYMPPPPFNVVTVQVWFTKDGSPVNITLADGTVVQAYGIQTFAMVPCPGTDQLRIATGVDGAGGQKQTLYLKVMPH